MSQIEKKQLLRLQEKEAMEYAKFYVNIYLLKLWCQ